MWGNVGVDRAVSGRFQVGGEREERVAEAREGRPDGRQDRNLIRILDTLAVDKEVYRKDGGNRQTG